MKFTFKGCSLRTGESITVGSEHQEGKTTAELGRALARRLSEPFTGPAAHAELRLHQARQEPRLPNPNVITALELSSKSPAYA
ncbi:MAG: hypothetical protein JWM11_3125 [Planctomycetaceae bacterium]|nr:hypothetical protein [Planctomycetaceae bacterium]